LTGIAREPPALSGNTLILSVMPSLALTRYILHRIRSRSKYDLHSPFVYKIYREILKDRTRYPEYEKIERLRKKLLQDPGFIRMTDFGTRAPEIAWCRNTVPVRRIVRTSSVNRKYGRLLFRLSRSLKPASILELGTSLGISTAYLAAGYPESMVTSIEGCEETAARARQNMAAWELPHVRIITAPFDEVLSYLLPEIGVVDLAFFDGNHRKEATLRYFQQCVSFIHDDSVFIFDDIHWSDEMEKAWEEIREHPSVKVSLDLFRMGMVFFREGLSKEDFILHF